MDFRHCTLCHDDYAVDLVIAGTCYLCREALDPYAEPDETATAELCAHYDDTRVDMAEVTVDVEPSRADLDLALSACPANYRALVLDAYYATRWADVASLLWGAASCRDDAEVVEAALRAGRDARTAADAKALRRLDAELAYARR